MSELPRRSHDMIAGRMRAQQGNLSYQLLATLRGHTEQVYDLAFSSDDAILAAACLDGTVWLWDTVRFSSLHTLIETEFPRPLLGPTPPPRLTFSPDGAFLAVSIGNGLVRIYDPHGNRVHTLSEAGWHVTDAMVAASGRHLITADRAGEVRFWDVSSWQCVHRFSVLPQSESQHNLDSALPIHYLVLSPDGRLLAVVLDTEPASVQLYEVARDMSSVTLLGGALEHGYALSMPAFSPDSSLVSLADPCDHCATILRARSLQPVASCCPSDDIAVATSFTRDGHLLAVAGGERGIVRMWDMRSARFIGGIPAHTEGWGEGSPAWKMNVLAISSGGRVLATGGMDYPVGVTPEEPYFGPVDWTIKLWAISTDVS